MYEIHVIIQIRIDGALWTTVNPELLIKSLSVLDDLITARTLLFTSTSFGVMFENTFYTVYIIVLFRF